MTVPFGSALKKFASNNEGAALVEYGLLVLLIAVLCIATIKLLGSKINNTMNAAGSSMP